VLKAQREKKKIIKRRVPCTYLLSPSGELFQVIMPVSVYKTFSSEKQQYLVSLV
jgi:hypothetical protein